MPFTVLRLDETQHCPTCETFSMFTCGRAKAANKAAGAGSHDVIASCQPTDIYFEDD